ncbi:MAG: hypothetical protein R3F41_06505 [Gammaproteobacteria bacterium]|nr:hypothetical protein [Pseudomonadales bacterium]
MLGQGRKSQFPAGLRMSILKIESPGVIGWSRNWLSFTLMLLLSTTASGQDFAYRAERDFSGRIYHYRRSNIDGTLPELVSVYLNPQGTIEVFKRRSACTQSALVIAAFNLETLTFDKITSGNLGREGEQQEFASLVHDTESNTVTLSVDLPDQSIRLSTEINNPHYELYDFDFASLTASTPHLVDPVKGFDSELLLVWADPGAPSFSSLGNFEFEYLERQRYLNHDTLRFTVTGPGGDDAQAALWLDAIEGYIVEARLSLPNHAGYENFRLQLLGTEQGEDTWRNLLLSQFAACP